LFVDAHNLVYIDPVTIGQITSESASAPGRETGVRLHDRQTGLTLHLACRAGHPRQLAHQRGLGQRQLDMQGRHVVAPEQEDQIRGHPALDHDHDALLRDAVPWGLVSRDGGCGSGTSGPAFSSYHPRASWIATEYRRVFGRALLIA
jgi:hypothetical protein